MAVRAECSSGGGFLMGIMAGTALGAALAVLFVPKGGREVRQDLADSVADFNEAAKGKWKDVTAVASTAVSKGLEAYDQARGTATQAAGYRSVSSSSN